MKLKIKSNTIEILYEDRSDPMAYDDSKSFDKIVQLIKLALDKPNHCKCSNYEEKEDESLELFQVEDEE